MLRLILLACCLGVLATGCESKPKGTSVTPPANTAPVIEEAKGAPGEIAAQVIDANGFQTAIAKHAGKVVLVDCWAMWCIPCRKAFPHTVELSKKYADQGLVVISLSFDDPTDEGTPPPKVLEFLNEHQAAFDNYVSSAELGTPAAEGFEIEDATLPHFKLYGRDGKLLKVFSGGDEDQTLTPEVLEQAVVDALK